MKRPLFVALILSLALSACSSILPQTQPNANNGAGEVPQVNIQETAAAMAGTMAVQTIAALPTPTVVTPSRVVAVSPTATGSATVNIMATTATFSATAITATGTPTITPINTATQTQTQTPIPSNGLVTPTVTSPLTYYGTLPPDLPYGFVTLSNKSKVEANISLQCTTIDGYTTILEYSGIKGTFDIHAPAGKYEYVAWVGGKQIMGKFSLAKRQELLITLYKDKVVIR